MNLLLTEILDEAFADQFKPISSEEYLERSKDKLEAALNGITSNYSTWTFAQDIIRRIGQSFPNNPEAQEVTDNAQRRLRAATKQYYDEFFAKVGKRDPNYPILSHRYDQNVYNTEELDVAPKRAYAFRNAVTTLEGLGVKWIEFSRLRSFPKPSFVVVTGIQAVGRYEDLTIILETKVGVYPSSAGYLSYVGKETNPHPRQSRTSLSVDAAKDKVIWKIEKLTGHKLTLTKD